MARKKGRKQKLLEQAEHAYDAKSSLKEEKMGKIKPSKKRYTVLAVALLLAVLLFLFVKNWFLVSTVNGQPIFRSDLIAELEKRYAKQTLDSLTTKSLILQEAKKQNVVSTDEEVNDYIEQIKKDLEARGEKIEDLLAMQGMTEADLKEQIGIQKKIERILGDKIAVSDEEIANYLKQASSEAEEPTAEEKDKAREQLKQQKLSTEFNTWIKSVKDQAEIQNFATF